jgi:hypothetical protein
MKILRTENIIYLLWIALYVGVQSYSLHVDDTRSERQERCFTQAKDDNLALNICSEISSAADGAVRSAHFSIFPDMVLLFGFVLSFAVKTRRLETEVKELKEKLDV